MNILRHQMIAVSVLDRDTRTLRQYLKDLMETERRGVYPEYSKKRRLIIMYWERAVKKGLVSLDDKMYEAVDKMRLVRRTSPP